MRRFQYAVSWGLVIASTALLVAFAGHLLGLWPGLAPGHMNWLMGFMGVTFLFWGILNVRRHHGATSPPTEEP